jgi:hypothetical protein
MDRLFYTFLKFAVYRNSDIPSACDELWCLKRIRKNGTFQQALEKNGIPSVKDVLRRYHKDKNALRNVKQELLCWILSVHSLPI